MRSGNRWIAAGLAVLFAAFFAGAAHLFLLRYEVGDVYPPYSTFRADPLGAKAIYEALVRTPSVQAERNVKDLKRLAASPPPTMFVLGVPPEMRWWEETPQSAESLAAVTNGGGRLVVAFAPTRAYLGDEDVLTKIRFDRSREDEEKKDQDKDGEKGDPDELVDLRDTWKIDLNKPESPTGDGQEDRRKLTATTSQGGALPRSLEWHSIAYFKPSDEAWKTIYECDGKPVALERTLGSGTLVMLSDSYLFSNEAMRKAPETELLAWLMGPNERVVFDEAHLGILEKQGVMTLARKYRLHGFALGLAVLAVLFLWKSLVRLTPPYDDEFDRSAWYSKGREAAEGLTNLLRRSVKPRDLLATCLNEWKRAVGMRRPESRKKLEKMQAIVDAQASRGVTSTDVVVAYRDMVRIATERK